MTITYSVSSIQNSAVDQLGALSVCGTLNVQDAVIFEKGLTLYGVSNQIILQPSGPFSLTATAPFTITLTATNPAANRTYTIPDAGAAANFVMSAGTQTIAGANTFTLALAVSATSNQLVLGTTLTTTINATAPAVSRIMTIPDPGQVNTNFILSANPIITINLVGTTTLNLTTHPGAILWWDNSVAALIALPAVATAAGYKYHIQIKANGTANTVTAASAVLNGSSAQGAVAAAIVNRTILTVSSTNLTAGDSIDLISDGVRWNCFIVCAVASSVTFT